MDAAKAKTEKLINDHAVIMFSKSYCPYCKSAKEKLTKLRAKFEVYELDKQSDGHDIQNALKEMTSQETVPNIFIGKIHIGGSSDLDALGPDLRKLLGRVGVI